MASEWFPGDGRTPEGQDFLAELRARAASWGLADVRASDTGTASDRWGWLVAYARVPGVRDGAADVQLQVGFGLAATAVPLVSAWGTDGVRLDRWAELGLSGYDSSPAGMARRTYDWFTEQLLRHVERLSWRTRRNGTTSLWRLSDSEGPVWAQHAARRRFDRGARPDDVVRVR